MPARRRAATRIPRRELGRDLLQLLLELAARERLAAQPPAADRAAANRQKHPGIAKAAEDVPLIASSVRERPAIR